MVKDKNKDLLKLIHEHTHLKNEDGEDVPFFCFTHDIMDTIDLDMSEEEIAQIALDNGYKVYKVFPEETMVGGLILCAEGCPKEAIDKMYEEFYGEIPTIEEWPTKELTEEKKKDPRLAQAGVSGYNQPKRTPNHPTKSHIVVAKEGDEIKTIRFGEQGAETAGKPKKSESERMKAKRKSFKARHAKNIAKGKMSAAYWANKIKW